MKIDFSSLRPIRPPTRREASNYRSWVKYLRNSKLSNDEIYRRAATLTAQGRKPPRD